MLAEVVTEAARRFGDAVAVVAPDGRPTTYAELDRLSDAAAAEMQRMGAGIGSVVALALPASTEYIVGYAAAAKIGAITAGVNPRLTANEQAKMLDLVAPTLTFTETAAITALTSADGATPDAVAADDDRPVAIVFTSGTTGVPKGAVFANRQLRAVSQIDVGGKWGGGDNNVAAVSLAHVGFMTKLPWYLMSGGTRYLFDKWDAETNLRLIEEHRMTNVGGVAPQVALMLRHPNFEKYDVSSVRTVVLGGGPAPVPLQREAQKGFGAAISVRYSSTETGGCGTGTSFEDPIGDEYGVGKPRGPIDVAIRDDEVCVRSPAVMSGYYGDADATAAAFTDDGFVRTGDLGWIDDDGRLHLSGRSKEMYVRGGYNVFPAEVETVLLDHPSVAGVAVVAKPDLVMGERAVAVVVARRGAPEPSLAELRDFAKGRIASYKLPDELLLVDEIPLTAMDKVDRRALEARVRPAN